MKQIKLTVTTGYVNCRHETNVDLPDDWPEMTEEDQGKFMDECASDYLHECCQAYSEIV